MARSCCGDPATPDADVVWNETPAFVAVRDMTACGCAPGFVAGLALPRTRVTGIEDPARPDAIWPFAWETARARIPDELAIGLAINPEVVRSQNQLHVHMLRLKPGVRDRLDAALATDPTAWGDASAILLRLPDLGHVFATVAERVGDAAMGVHGVLVARAPGGGFVALITDRSSPQVYTENRCTR
jgi:CDP-diacylglycerol pyrophosphatase